MKTVFSAGQLVHHAIGEVNRGVIVSPYECPRRAMVALDAITRSGLGPVVDATAHDRAHLCRVHSENYVDFLEGAYQQWTDEGRSGDAIPMSWPTRGFRQDIIPDSIDARLAYYSFEISTPVTAGTWSTATSAANVALTGADIVLLENAPLVFSLCRPPGHHAGIDFFGGYCFLNNAAIAAQYFRDKGMSRVAILDVDYHHGNGTQQIFESRSDVFYASIHGNPATEFPYFLGYADETGTGEGEGFNLNLPLPSGTDWARYSEALGVAMARINAFKPDAIVISLGVDTFEDDPISNFRLTRDDFARLGEALKSLGRPTLVVFEGGYAIDEIGNNLVTVLSAMEAA